MSRLIMINQKGHSFAVVPLNWILKIHLLVIFLLLTECLCTSVLILELNAALLCVPAHLCSSRGNSIILSVTNVSLSPHSQMCTSQYSTSVTWKGHGADDLQMPQC